MRPATATLAAAVIFLAQGMVPARASEFATDRILAPPPISVFECESAAMRVAIAISADRKCAFLDRPALELLALAAQQVDTACPAITVRGLLEQSAANPYEMPCQGPAADRARTVIEDVIRTWGPPGATGRLSGG